MSLRGFSGVSPVYRTERGVNQPPLSSANTKEWVELCLHSFLGLHVLSWGDIHLCA